jgi:hypothetical protein
MSSVNGSGGSIPRIIHQIWVQGVRRMPQRYRENAATWSGRNPGWMHRLWDEWSLRELLLGGEWWPLYTAQPDLAARADVARYALLQRFGGVYTDIDTECRRSIDPLFDRSAARLHVTLYSHPRCRRWSDVTNSFLASTPAHPLWSSVLSQLARKDRAPLPTTVRTGPAMLAPLLEQHAARAPGDVRVVGLPFAFTTALVPLAVMRAFSRLFPENYLLDFNDAGRAAVPRVIRNALRAASGMPPAASCSRETARGRAGRWRSR